MNFALRKNVRKYVVCMFPLVTVIVFCVNSMSWRRRQPENNIVSSVMSQRFKTNSVLASKERNRILRLNQQCSNSDLYKKWIYKGHLKNRSFLYSQKYNISYCKVPKTGSTFWTQLLFLLETENVTKWKAVFQMDREVVHVKPAHNEYEIQEYFGVNKPSNRIIIVSRDPYPRLYSAYIDKVYLGGLSYLARNMAKYLTKSASKWPVANRTVGQTPVDCLDSITFSDFLHYISKEVSNRHILDRHWSPIASLCPSCSIDHVLLAKQESFAEDVEYVLNVLNVDSNKTCFIKDVLYDHRLEQTLPGLLSAVMSKALHAFRCLSQVEIRKRIWRALQIQRYVDDAISFPFNKFMLPKTMSSSSFIEVVMDTIKRFPLTSTQSAIQKRKYLVNAYKAVDSDTIKSVQRIYYADFKLFGYSLDPPNLF